VGERDQRNLREQRNIGENRNLREQRNIGQNRNLSEQNRTGFAQGTTTHSKVSLNSQQRTRIQSVVVNKNFVSRFRVSSVNFALSVGTVVPRSFHLFVVPEDIVVIAPRFRGFKFFIVEDEIVFVDPVTFEIVAVIPV